MRILAIAVLTALCAARGVAAVAPAGLATAPAVAGVAEARTSGVARAAAVVTVPAAREAGACAASPGAVVAEARGSGTAVAAPVGVVPPASAGESCDLVTMYARMRILSGPWAASRRLKAARLRGDADEAARMEAKLSDLLLEALKPGEDP